MYRHSLIISFLVVSLGTASVLAENRVPYWPQFHGPNRDNVSTETGLLESWPDEGPQLVWRTAGIGHGFSTVSIADGRILTAGNIDGKTVVTAMNMRGKILWQTACGAAWTKPYGGSRGTPTIDGERIYYETPFGDVVCLEAETGKKLWSLNILEQFSSKNITWGLAESLMVDGDRVICTPGGPRASVVALDKNSGDVVWTAPSTSERAGYASPVLTEYQGVRMIITMTSHALIAVDADSGDLLWRFEHVTYADENITRPIVHNDQIFISTIFDAASVKLQLRGNQDKISVEELWRSDDLDNQHGGVVLLDGYLYGACRGKNNGKWVCLDWATGRMMYADRGVGRGSLTYADGMLYVVNEKRTVALVEADPTQHEVISSFEIPSGQEGPTWAHPVVCGGCLYIRHSDHLFAYDI